MHEIPKHITLPVGELGRVNKEPQNIGLTGNATTVPGTAVDSVIPVDTITFGGWVTHTNLESEHYKTKHNKGDGILEGSRRPSDSDTIPSSGKSKE